MTFQPLLPWAIFAVVVVALVVARLFALRQVLQATRRRRLRAVLRWTGVTLAVLLLLGATTRPGLRADEPTGSATAGGNLNVFLVLDRPIAAPAVDDLNAVLDTYPAARYALITENSLDWPLSQDIWSLRPTIAALVPAVRADGEPEAPADLLADELSRASQLYPGSLDVVLYLGSVADRSPPALDVAPGSVDGGAVLGYGGTGGTQLADLAARLGVPYLVRAPGQPMQLQLPDSPGAAPDPAERFELYWLPALIAGVLLLVEIYLSIRDFRRGRISRRDVA